MMQHISAAAPRFLLRLFVVDRLLSSYKGINSPHELICEIGPGLGDVASYSLEKLDVRSMHLFDSSSKARSILAKRFIDLPSIKIMEAFSSVKNLYDLVFCFEVIEHIEEDLRFLETIHSSLKIGGYLIGSVPAYQRKWQAVDVLAGHYRRYSPYDMRTALAKAGFTDIKIETYGFPLINLMYPLRQFYYSRQLRLQADDSKAAATARSGVARGLCQSFNTPLIYSICRMFDIIQKFSLAAPLDDGLVFICRKT